MTDITWRVLQGFCDRMLADHSKKSVKKYFIVIRGALDDAVRDGAILSNPESLVKWPKAKQEQKARALSRGGGGTTVGGGRTGGGADAGSNYLGAVLRVVKV